LEPKQGNSEKPNSLKSGTTKRTVWKGKDTKPAVTEYKVKKYFNLGEQKFSLIEAMPKTGRTHQIRIHFSSIGHPVVGDELYGFKKRKLPFGLNRQFLHAKSLEFPTEEGKMIKIEANLAEDLEEFLKKVD